MDERKKGDDFRHDVGKDRKDCGSPKLSAYGVFQWIVAHWITMSTHSSGIQLDIEGDSLKRILDETKRTTTEGEGSKKVASSDVEPGLRQRKRLKYDPRDSPDIDAHIRTTFSPFCSSFHDPNPNNTVFYWNCKFRSHFTRVKLPLTQSPFESMDSSPSRPPPDKEVETHSLHFSSQHKPSKAPDNGVGKSSMKEEVIATGSSILTSIHRSSMPSFLRLPYELVEDIARRLCRNDRKSLRLTCRTLEQKSSWFFKSVVVPFTPRAYNVNETDARLGRESSTSPNPRYSPSMQGVNDVLMFSRRGHSIRRFAFTMEFDEEILALPLPKLCRPASQSHGSFYGKYLWPEARVQRFEQFETMEDVGGDTQRMSNALGHLSKATHLGLCLNSGLGWLKGPDTPNDAYEFIQQPVVFNYLQEPRNPDEEADDAIFLSNLRDSLFPMAKSVQRKDVSSMFIQYCRILEAHHLTDPTHLEMLYDFMKSIASVGVRRESTEELQELYWNMNLEGSSASSLSGNSAECSYSQLLLMSENVSFYPEARIEDEASPEAQTPQSDFWTLAYSLVDKLKTDSWNLDAEQYSRKLDDLSPESRRVLDVIRAFSGEDLDGVDNRTEGLAHRMHQNRQAAKHNLAPNRLTPLQSQVLIEYGFAQRAFLLSFMLSVMSGPITMPNVRTLNLANISSTFLLDMDRNDFWQALRHVSKLTLMVSADWRRFASDMHPLAPDFNQEVSVLPSSAAKATQHLLEKHILKLEALQELHIGYVGGGEHATGAFDHNRHVLPAPLFRDEDGKKLLKFGHVKHLTLANCWATTTVVKGIVRGSHFKSLKLDSFSLLAFDGQTLSANRYSRFSDVQMQDGIENTDLDFDVRLRGRTDIGLFVSQKSFWQHWRDNAVDGDDCLMQKPFEDTWSELLDAITPGNNFEDERRVRGVEALELEPGPKVASSLERLELKSVGYVILAYQYLPFGTFCEHSLSGLDVKGDGVESTLFRGRYHEMEGKMMQTHRSDIYCGRNLPVCIAGEREMLTHILGLTTVAGGIRTETPQVLEDCQIPNGFGRYSGVLRRQAEQ